MGQPDDDNDNYAWGSYILPFIEQQPIYDQLKAGGAALVYIGGGDNLKVHSGIQSVGSNTVPDPVVQNTDSYNWWCQVRNNHGDSVAKTVLNVFICPSDTLPKIDNDGYGKSNYCCCLGDDAPWVDYALANGTSWSAPSGGGDQTGMFRLAQSNTYHYVTSFSSLKDGSSNVIALGEVSETPTRRSA